MAFKPGDIVWYTNIRGVRREGPVAPYQPDEGRTYVYVDGLASGSRFVTTRSLKYADDIYDLQEID